MDMEKLSVRAGKPVPTSMMPTPRMFDALAEIVTELADPDGRGIRVGYISRLPLTALDQLVAFPEGYDGSRSMTPNQRSR